MIFKKIAKLAKESGRLGTAVGLIGEEHHSWIFVDKGLYESSELPEMTFEQLCAMFDFSTKVKEAILDSKIRADDLLVSAVSALNIGEYNEPNAFKTYIGDLEVIIFTAKEDSDVFAIITADSLSPVNQDSYTKCSLVKSAGDQVYLVVYQGLQISAIIEPYVPSVERIKRWRDDTNEIDICFSKCLKQIEAAVTHVDKNRQVTLE